MDGVLVTKHREQNKKNKGEIARPMFDVKWISPQQSPKGASTLLTSVAARANEGIS